MNGTTTTDRARARHAGPIPRAHQRSPERSSRPPERRRLLGRLAGLAAVAAVLAVGGFALGPFRALLVIGAPSTFMMPVLMSIGDWSAGVNPHRRGARALNTALVILLAAALTVVAQVLAGHFSFAGTVRGGPVTTQHVLATFPYLIPLGALAFVSFLHLSIVNEGRLVFPQRRGPAAGRLAVVGCELVALAAYGLLANWDTVSAAVRAQIGLHNPGGPFPALDVATWLIVVSVFQTSYLVFGGWPLDHIARRPIRLALANPLVVALGSAAYFIPRDLIGVSGPEIGAAGASAIAGQLIAGPLLGLGSGRRSGTGLGRLRLAGSALAIAIGVYAGLRALGLALASGWSPAAPVQLWIVICGLNLIGGGVLWWTRVIAPDSGAAIQSPQPEENHESRHDG